MKRFKELICLILVCALCLSDLQTAQAFTIAQNGSVSSSSPGSASCGPSGQAWGYAISLKDLKIPAVMGSPGEKAEIDNMDWFENAYDEYAHDAYPTIRPDSCLLVQLDGADYTSCPFMEDSLDKANVKAKHAAKRTATNTTVQKVNPWTEALVKYYWSCGSTMEERTEKFIKDLHSSGKTSDSFITKVKKAFPNDVPSTDTCRSAVIDVLASGNKCSSSMRYFSGTYISTTASSLVNKYSSIPTTGRGKVTFYTLANLGAYITVAYAIDYNSNKEVLKNYFDKTFYYSINGEVSSIEFPVILINSVMPFYYGGHRWWATVPHFLSWLMGVKLVEFTQFYKRIGKDIVKRDEYSLDFWDMVYYIHENRYKDGRVSKRTSGLKCHGNNDCMKYSTNRMFSKKINCSATKASDFWKSSTSSIKGTQMCGIYASAWKDIPGSPGLGFFVHWNTKPEIPDFDKGFKTTFSLSDPATNNPMDKGWATKDGVMENHPLYLKDVKLDFSDGYKLSDLTSYIKSKKYTDSTAVTVTFNVYRKEYKKKPKPSLSNSNVKKNVAKKFRDQTESGVLKMGSSGTGTYIVKSSCKVSDPKISGVTATGKKLDMTVKQLKTMLKNPDKYPLTIKTDKITNDFTKQKSIYFRYVLDCTVTFNGNDKAQAQCNTPKDTMYSCKVDPDDPTTPEPQTYESAVATPYAELKCGSVTDSGANEPFEAMAGFPTTRDIYFASGGSEYVAQVTYEYRSKQNGKRTYTQDTSTKLSSLTIPYKTQTADQDSPSISGKPADLKATCPDCGAKVSTTWFPFRTAETKWDWEATATVPSHITGYTGGKNPSPIYCGGASKTTTKSNSDSPGPDAVATCPCGTTATVAQHKVKATQWNWEWRNYGHANSYLSSDAESLPYTDCKTFTNSRTESKTNTQNSKYQNTTTTVSNASESCTMPNTNKSGITSYITSWDQKITDFNYAEITDCKVWKLVKSKCSDTYDLVNQDEITASVQTTDDSELYNIAGKNTAKDGRFWHSEKTKDQDEYKFTTYSPKSCEFCVAYNAGLDLKSKNPQSIFNNTYAISDYLVLRTTKGDLSLIYFEYDCKNTTIPVGTVKFSGSKNGGSFTMDVKDVPFTKQNDRATYEKICLKNPMSFKGIDLQANAITFGGYNGNYSSPSTKYVSTSGFTENIDITSLKINDPNYSKYKATTRPSPVFKLVQNYDVPDTTVSNGLYTFGDSSVFYKNLINFGSQDPIEEIEAQDDYSSENGFVMTTTYSPTHQSINDVVVHDPVSSQYAMIIPLDKSRDQRTTSSLTDDEFHNNFPGQCTGDPSTCPYSHLHCTYNSSLYHDENCYDVEEVEYVIGEEKGTPQTYKSGQTINITAGKTYSIEVYGKVDGDAKGGLASGVYKASSDGMLSLSFTSDGVQVSALDKGGAVTNNYGLSSSQLPCSALTVGMSHIHCLDGCRDYYGKCTGVGCQWSSWPKYGTYYTSVPSELMSVTNGKTTAATYKWYHNDSGCSYAYETHNTTSTSYCTQCGHGCGYLASNTPTGGSVTNGTGKISSDKVTKGSTGASSESVAKVVITEMVKKVQSVPVYTLSCGEPHHAPNTNWRYYVSNWEKEDSTRSTGLHDANINSAKIRPIGSSDDFTKPSDMTSKYVLVQVEGELKLAAKDNPYVDPTTGRQWTLDQYSLTGAGSTDCIWALTDNDAPAYNTTTATASKYHYSFGDSTCWEACKNDANHKDTATATVGGKTYTAGGDFLNTDYGFQIYYPNTGNFYGNGAYGIGEASNTTGKGYTSPMDTTEWLKYKYVTFSFDVIYDRDGDGDFSDDKMYLGGEPIPLGEIGANGRFIDDSPNDYLYNFYIPLEQNEMESAHVGFYAVAINNEADAWYSNEKSHNFERNNYAAEHDSKKEDTIDVVGRIGALTMLDTGDFRYANLFKQIQEGWLVDNIVHKVDYTKQNYFMSDPTNIRGETGTTATNGLNTYGTQLYKNDLSKLIEFPLVPDKNNIDALKKQPQRVGYMNYMSLETIGNYYGENKDGDDTYKTQITPYYYHLDLTTGKWTPMDVYMLVGTQYKRIAEYGSTEATTDYEWIYSLNWQEERDRRMYTTEEKATTDLVVDKLKSLKTTLNDDGEQVSVLKSILIPSGKEYAYGTANRLFMKDKNRTFIGTTLTESTYTNPGERISEEKYSRNGQRWHFSLGLPSSAVFVSAGEKCTQVNIDKYANNHSVVVCAIDVLARGTVWTLKYSGVPTEDQVLKIIPNGNTYNYSGDPDGPGDKQIITVYSPNKSSKDDLNVEGTH